jgi:hypothetical protein
MVLFEIDPAEVLATDLRKEFLGRGIVTGGDVRTFVEDQTAFLKKHMTGALQQAEKAGGVRVESS